MYKMVVAAGCVTLALAASAPSVEAQSSDKTADQQPQETAPQSQDQQWPTSSKTPIGFRVGADLFVGISNINGHVKLYRDGIWDGSGPFYPSTVSLDWRDKQNRAFRLAVGIGELYTARDAQWREPSEAYFQTPIARGNLTLGKFYIPFATQEWWYESKWGMGYQGSLGRADLAISVTANPDTDAVNTYLRLGRILQKQTTIGFSLGLGRGLFYDSSHNTAFGLDVSQVFGRFQLLSEYSVAFGPNGVFQSLVGRLVLPRSGNLMPYVGAYYRHDEAGEQGNFLSYLAGANYRLTSSLNLEGAYARANDRNVFWVQMHFMLE